jgi:hypothetical protein
MDWKGSEKGVRVGGGFGEFLDFRDLPLVGLG